LGNGEAAPTFNRSEIGPLRGRDADVLIDVETKRVLGAGDFRPFAAVAQIDHVRGPWPRKRARVLDREIDLQILVLVVGVGRASGAPILFHASLPIAVFFVTLAVLRLKGHIAATLTVATALAVAILFYGMPVSMAVASAADAIALANDSDFGLAGAVWTKDVARAHRVSAAVKAGTFWVNSYKTINVASPFGGFNMSGHGRSSGVEALYEYTQVKSVWVETAAEPAVAFGYAPGVRE